ncbi:hypothetical protein R84B8_00172 [Treponema sp. R8-4-B8]
MGKNIFNVKPISRGKFEIENTPIGIIEFESAKEGDIIKICTDNHNLGITAEYAWIQYKYPDYERIKQELIKIKLNGSDVACDILTIGKRKLSAEEPDIKKVFFDISDFFDNPVK